MNETEYKQEHEIMWNYITEMLGDLAGEYYIFKRKNKLKNNMDNTNNIDNLDKFLPKIPIDLQEMKKLYFVIRLKTLQKNNLTPYEYQLKNKIENDIKKSCFACEFVYNPYNYINCRECPLLKSNGGNLEVECSNRNSIYRALITDLYFKDFDSAILKAIEIKNAWR